MKSLKIRLASILTLILMLVSTCVLAYDDTVGAWAETEIDFVSGYGIMQGFPDGNFYPDNAVTRAEIVAVALRMIKMDNPGSGVSHFNDVSGDHWACGVIEAAAQLGIVNGFPDGSFKPDNLVTYQEATKIFVSLLGYEPMAKAKGGYPAGYMTVAASEDLFNYSGVDAQTPASRAAIAVMCYNALQTEMMLPKIYASEGDDEYRISDVTMLDMYFNSLSGEGLVTATYVEGLSGKAAREGQIEIDHVVYDCDLDYSELLGNNVKYFYAEEDGGKRIIVMNEDASSQDKITVDATLKVGFTALFSANASFAYYEDEMQDDVEVIKISPSAKLIYNNEYIPYANIGAVDLDVKEGTIELIDNDRDGVFDCIKILSYVDYYVNNITTGSDAKYITDGIGSSIVYDAEDTYEKIVSDGSRIEFEEIPSGAVASAAISADGEAVEIIVHSESITGTVTEISTDIDYTSVWIDDAEYKVSGGAPARYVDIDVGDTGKFSLNFLGEVAYFEKDGADGEAYGYLTSVDMGGGAFGEYMIRILTVDNRFADIPIADKVKFFDKGYERSVTAEDIYNEFYHEPAFNDVRSAETQVIKYKLNPDGELSLLRTAAETPSTTEFSVGYINPVSGEAEGRRYYANRLFMQSYQITDDTVCFQIPWTEEGEDYTRYRVGSAPTYFSDGNLYQVKLFDVNEEKQIGAIMYTLYGQDKEYFFSLTANSPVMVVDKVSKMYDSETGDANTVVSGLVDGEYTSEIINPDYLSSMNSNMLKFGSVFQYATNKQQVEAAYYEGEPPAISSATLLCADKKSAETIKWNGGNVEMNSAGRKTTYGTVQKIVGFTVTVNLPDYPYGTEADYFLSESTQVIIANTAAETFTLGNFYDIRPDDRIFIRQRYNRIKEVVVYR